MTKLIPFLIGISVLFSGCKKAEENSGADSWVYTNGRSENEIVREYRSPEEIVWLSDTSGNSIKGSSYLLNSSGGQADLVGKNLCVLRSFENHHPSILLDFGKEIHGGIRIVTGMFKGKKPVNVRLTFGESVSEAMSRVETSSATNDHAMRDFTIKLPWLGMIETGNTGFRFVRIEMLDSNQELKLKEISAISVYRDIPYKGSFTSNDKRLNEIWKTGAYTVHLNMQDYLWDGIKRDRLVWVGDMHPEVMTILSVFGYNEVVPKSLNLIREITELPSWMNTISSYSMWWILIQYQWYLNTGDYAYLESQKEYIYELLSHLQSKIDSSGNEVLDGGRFLDWPTSPNKEAIHAGLQSLLLQTLETGSNLAEIFNDEEKSRNYSESVSLLRKHIPDPNKNKSGAALMALSGLADAKAVNDTLLAVNPLEGISTFYGYYVLKARAEAGDITGALEVIRSYWGGMLSLGATTFWEDFDTDWLKDAQRIDEMPVQGKIDVHSVYGDYCYKGLRHSLCHGWASGPTAWMSEYLLGVKVIEPGCKKVLINPKLGDLEWVEGSYPTPYGLIHLRHEKNPDGTISSVIDAPREVLIVQQ